MNDNEHYDGDAEMFTAIFIIIISIILFFVCKNPNPPPRVNKVLIDGHTYLVIKTGTGFEEGTCTTIHDENCVCKHK